MYTKKSVGDMTPLCGTPCLRSIFLLFVLSTATLARRLYIYDLINRKMFHHFFSFISMPSVQTCSNVFCISIHIVSLLFVLEFVFNLLC